jgi:hypothetical protein
VIRTKEDISEAISASLPSISDRRSASHQGDAQSSLHADIAELVGGEEEATPTHSPRTHSPQQEEVRPLSVSVCV